MERQRHRLFSRDEAKITLRRVPDKPGIAAGIFGPLAGRQHQCRHDRPEHLKDDGRDRHDLHRRQGATSPRAEAGAGKPQGGDRLHRLITDPDVVKVSVVGVGMRSHAGVAATMFKALAEKGINIQVISTSEIKVSVLIDEEYTELAVRALHTAYGLDAE
jgi:aspartate kinase